MYWLSLICIFIPCDFLVEWKMLTEFYLYKKALLQLYADKNALLVFTGKKTHTDEIYTNELN